MTISNPFGPGSPLHDLLKRQREQADIIKSALGPAYELQQRFKEMTAPLAALKDMTRLGVLGQL